ncbi:MAG: hypothetical protein CM15mP74_04610 [Halieaceae bacterium]|nr:MAG: hypothetical protein CM15mP74_04610 [Halieaceae bacterium]
MSANIDDLRIRNLRELVTPRVDQRNAAGTPLRSTSLIPAQRFSPSSTNR